MKKAVWVSGSGLLADCVLEELGNRRQIQIIHSDFPADIPAATEMALVLDDAWHPSVHLEAEERFKEAGIPWLRSFVSFGEGVVGPLVLPGKPGCSQCADQRQLMAGRDRKEMWALRRKLQEQGGVPRDAAASRPGFMQMASLIGAEVQTILEGKQALTEGRLAFIDLKTLGLSWHSFLPDSLCVQCGRLPDDSKASARISLQPSRKSNPDSYRTRPMAELGKVLAKDYLDHKTGFLNQKMLDLVPPFADASVNLPLFIGDEGAAGRTNSYATSELTAILEGLERYCGMDPKGKRTVIYDSYSNLKDEALNPLEVGVHSKDHYEQADFPFRPFDPDTPMNWVWGYSFLEDRPLLVPELLAYYSLGCGEGFVFETSNGCALGGSLEEAIFYGIMEVVERDSFLLTWYGQLPLPRLDPRTADDRELQLMIERAKAVAGYDTFLYNAMMEHGIPSVWAMAKNRKQEGLNIICAAGAHLDPVRAAKSAMHELGGMMLTLDEKFVNNRPNYEKMLHNPMLVQQMEDHGMLFGLPETEGRLGFLLDHNRPLRSFSEEFADRPVRADLKDDLVDVLQKLHERKLDVIVVDQTVPEIKRNGLHCVKVLIPGMLPMTFGHHLTRVQGLERVLEVPKMLGYKEAALTYGQLNPYPHPFP
ncbi:TOMM precursor leader peptide-binding protein [Bacillus testis]|uniref:TOMM precursor leader peptide-binding protein n=1 Tax=Bacillus testis TaxID=1622072 RepID=UPI00067F11AB|nr:TOMM precursor leader peptide-binding protein [Bacillus testis]